ncbi:2OG-Fe(II) oxygenase [Methylophaga sp. OBS4]|uniref:2OG-Fe(II) oxygenase n=1 Tax=Methylophaga sp. OBS4 TaxID=2991935 RepID=UPI002251346B|nr:2OG-Fe(II) oxygenase [Methylophaga sp. OBS4]MCX4187061.1 2OG-Fe(II) oxygenase [Methylophaga sp. OBS4]
MQNVLNLDALSASPVRTDPFPFFTVDNAIDANEISAIISDFPAIDDGGSYNIDDVAMGPAFKQLIDSLDTPQFRKIICDKFDVKVMELPMMVTLRGFSRKKDGRIHTDSKTKVATILIYLNEQWPAATGKLRILRNGDDMDDYVDEITPGPGALLAFKVTDNCWHGYPSFEGKRQSIQINFLTSEAASSKHRFFHRLSAKVKSLFK